MNNKPIILIGMMGCGKTSVGRMLAGRMGRDFFDSDRKIEKATGRTVLEIFKSEGEAAFRSYEKEVLASLLNQNNAVIAAGGGALLAPETVALIREKAISIWLTGEALLFYERVKNTPERPLLAGPDGKEKFTTLYRRRLPGYQSANFKVAADGPTQEETLKQILEILENDR